MQVPLQITFHEIPASETVENDVRRSVDELEKFCDRIVSCRVSIDAPHRHHHQGRRYRVLVDLGVPGTHLVAGRSPDEDAGHEDVYIAIRDSFRAVTRQLEDYVRQRRGEVKLHAAS
jgi:ribosome-associated translation inhibitor RaiA